MNRSRTQASIENLFRRKVQKDVNLRNAYLLVHSDKLGIHMNVAEGVSGDYAADPRQPYFIASIGKLFTAVVVGMLVERGRLTFEDPVSRYIDRELMNGLHVYKGTDCGGDIRIRHLLNHTSGLNCYIEDKPLPGKSIVQQMLDEPDRVWTPRELIEWSKAHLTAHFPPGRGFHYSDTGYNVLGLVVERVTGQPLHEVLREFIFDPLDMRHSYQLLSQPKEPSEYPRAHVCVGDVNVIDYPGLSISYAGGGIISTSEDLLAFMKALVGQRLVSEATIDAMKRDKARFFPGIDYGYGIMQIKTVPILMPRKYNAWGNAGSIGSFLFYHPATETYLIGNLNRFRYGSKGIRLMLKLVHQLA